MICGTEARLDVLGAPAAPRAVDGREPRLYAYRAAQLVAGRDGVPRCGEPAEATDATAALLERLS